MDMNMNEYYEVINGEKTYCRIANELLNGKTVGIGWTDEESTHYDILFFLGIDVKQGQFQRGLRQNYLYVSIIDKTSFGFIPNSTKENGYIQEKLRMNNTSGDKVADLINGIIFQMNNIETFDEEDLNEKRDN